MSFVVKVTVNCTGAFRPPASEYLPRASWKASPVTALQHNNSNSINPLDCPINPWTYRQIHTPTVVRGGGGGWIEPLPGVLDMLQYFETILPGKPLIFVTRWGIFYEWWCCWRPVTSPNVIAILATNFDLKKNWKSSLNREKWWYFCALHEK